MNHGVWLIRGVRFSDRCRFRRDAELPHRADGNRQFRRQRGLRDAFCPTG